MFGQMLRRLKGAGRAARADALYAAIVARARQPAFYTRLGVPDTVMGRYEMIVLHVILVLDTLLRLRQEMAGNGAAAQERHARELARALQEAMFDSMDAALREVGVSDPAMPKRMEKLVSLFYGQLKSYRAALAQMERDEAAAMRTLRQVLARNIFLSEDVAMPGVAVLASSVRRTHAALARHSLDDLAAGRLAWPAIIAGAPGGTN